MKRIALLLMIVMLLLSAVSAQETDIPEPQIKKNSVYVTGGIFILYYNIQLNYERVVWEPDLLLLKTVSIKTGAGWWETLRSKGTSYSLSLSAMSGKRDWHFEYALGICYFPDYFVDLKFIPAVNGGLRYQKPGNSFIFRVGVGLPEFAYLSIGYAF